VPIIRTNNCTNATLGTCYSVWMIVWYAGWNSTLHTHTKKNCEPNWLYLQDYTRMHGQQNIRFISSPKAPTDSGTHRASYYMGTRVPFPRVNCSQRESDNSPLLVPMLRTSEAIPSFHLNAFMACIGTTLHSLPIMRNLGVLTDSNPTPLEYTVRINNV